MWILKPHTLRELNLKYTENENRTAVPLFHDGSLPTSAPRNPAELVSTRGVRVNAGQ